MTAAPVEAEELSLPEIHKKHASRWVAVVVTRRDENGQPAAGRVVAEDADRYRLRDTIAPYKDICIFYAGESLFPLFL